MRACGLENRSGSRCTGKERDAESGLDSFGFRHYASTMGRWMSPDLVNVTEDRLMAPSSTLNKYAYAANNPLKYIDPDGRDVTYFYDQGGIAGHAILFAYNQATGDSAIESFGPEYKLPIAPGVSMFEMNDFTSADDLRSKLTSLTIQTTPELAQQVIDYIRANPDPALWIAPGPNCSSEVWKILQKFKLGQKASPLDAKPGQLPRNVWKTLIFQYNPSQQGITPKNGQDYGNPRFDMFNLMWLSLPQSQPKATVTTTTTNCVTDDKGNRTCNTF
ncbi:MAG: RHS repeat-associated core domain-containing protein [Terriglobales bacterium]